MDLFDPNKAAKPSTDNTQQLENVGSLVPKGMQVSRYEIRPLNHLNIPSYEKHKASFSAEARRTAARFQVSDHVRNQLSVEQEEQQRFEQEVARVVEERVQALKEEITKAAYEDGFNKGAERGYQEKLSEIQAREEKLKLIVNDLEISKQTLANNYQNQLTALALKIAEALLHYEIKNSPQMIHHTIAEILEHISKNDDVLIRISKSYTEFVEDIQKELSKLSGSSERRLQIELSEDLEPGNTIVESSSGEIASFINDKVELLKEKLLSNMENSRAAT